MPPPPPSSQGSQQGDHSLAPLWISILLFSLCWLVWEFFHAPISNAVLHVRLWEAEGIAWFTNQGAGLIPYIKSVPADQVHFDQLSDISAQVGSFLRYPIAVILGLLGIVLYCSHTLLRFRKRYTMKSLVEAERENWLQITPVAKLNLVDVDIDEGPWAMALSPMQFAKKNQLLRKEKVLPVAANKRIDTRRNPLQVSVKRDLAHTVFSLQLGPLWEGVEHLPIHRKALFAVFAARINQDRAGALKLLLQISASAHSGAVLNFSGIDELLKKHQNNKSIHYIINSHAYVLAVMASMLALARYDGVLASADFLWLKPTDRVLWFMLNSIGRQTAFSEVAGPFAHWQVERAIGRKLVVPMVEEAVNGLDSAIKDSLYIPEGDDELE